MKQVVLCEVSNCVYNIEGKKCDATEIFVVSQKGNSACKTFEEQE